MAKAYSIRFNYVPPRISLTLNITLQFSPNTKTRDWYLFENHTILRIYGLKEDPYLLPTFL